MRTEAAVAEAAARGGRVLGYRVDPVSREDAVKLVVERALRPEPGAYVCLTNVHTTVESQRSAALRAACDGAFLSVPDGVPLVWELRRQGHRRVEKVAGIEHIHAVAAAGRRHGLRHYFFGGAPGVAEAAAANLERNVPGTIVAGTSTPPFGPHERWQLDDLRAGLREARPHVMWVGLGAPKQELWMADVAGSLDVPVMVGVGAVFDFLAGTKKAAPRFLSEIGLEWAYRLASEPRRLWRRYLVGNSRFVYLLAREALAGQGGSR